MMITLPTMINMIELCGYGTDILTLSFDYLTCISFFSKDVFIQNMMLLADVATVSFSVGFLLSPGNNLMFYLITASGLK